MVYHGRKKKLPVGIDNFVEIRTEDFYYVDKTAMIRDLLYTWGKVNLFTRPRRFGKSLNMSMLKAFLEIGCDPSLFEDLAISKETSLCDAYMGQFPVISVSLKSAAGEDFETARAQMCNIIGKEALRFRFLLDSDRLTAEQKEMYRKLIEVDSTHSNYFNLSETVLRGSLSVLSELLWKHYEKKVIILIDEYDVPLATANERGYYTKMVDLICSMFDQALKSNDSLYFAVLTGCLRVAKESIFTGLNNPRIFSISSAGFDEYFGFTDAEVRNMLEYYGVTDRYETIKEWYDGYRIGDTDVYCPWDVINICAELQLNSCAVPKDYWSNTSGNDVVRHFIESAGNEKTKNEIEALVAGETVEKEIHEDLTYNHLYDTIDNIWSILFATGYLTQRGITEDGIYQLSIPNREVRNIFTRQIREMFHGLIKRNRERLEEFCIALKSGDAAKTEKLFTMYLYDMIAVRDSSVHKEKKENFYHGIMLGILFHADGWEVKSNTDAGDGYCDVKVEIEREDIGMILEFKYAEGARFLAACKEAMAQIERMDYASELKHEGYHTIFRYGIACFKRKCKVVCEKETYDPEEV